MLKKLPWDSNFYNLEIYSLQIKEFCFDNNFINKFEINELSPDLVYIFSSRELPKTDYINKSGNLCLVDKKVTFTKFLGDSNESLDSNIIEFKNENSSLLYDLSYEAGKFSRFKKDKKLKNKFEDLYKLWVDNSVHGLIADFTIIYKSGNLVQSFVTGKTKNHIGKIGLIATAPNLQGKGIGSKLLKGAEYYFKLTNAEYIEVDTQLENFAACDFYQKNGFNIKEIIYVYHYWPNYI